MVMFIGKISVFLVLKSLLISCKILSGIVLGLGLAIAVQALTNCSTLAFVFVVVSVTLAFIRLTWPYKFKGLIVVNLLFVVLFFLFKLYVKISAVSS